MAFATGAGGLERWSLVASAEVHLVGLAAGPHFEVLFRPLAPDGWLHLRAGAAIGVGPELVYLPVDLGVRAHLWPRRRVHPELGLAVQLQGFAPYGTTARARGGIATEGGLSVTVGDGWRVGLVLSPEIGSWGGFGFGFAARLGVRHDLG
jgi:hypothetical protein